MTQSEELFARAQRLIPGGVNSPVRAFKAVGRNATVHPQGRGRADVGRGRQGLHRLHGVLGAADPGACPSFRDRGHHPGRGPRHLVRRALRGGGGAGGPRGAPGAEHPEGPLRLLGDGSDHERAAARARLHRAPQDPQVRGLLSRPRGRAAGGGGLGRGHPRHSRLAGRARRHGRGHADRALQRPRRGREGGGGARQRTSPPSSSSPWPGTWAWSLLATGICRACATWPRARARSSSSTR